MRPAAGASGLCPAGRTPPGQWSEIDLEKAEWRIPAERMKMREQHIVPLSRQAIDILP